MPFGRLDGRRAFVSGGARGIGAAIARSLAGAGARVVIADLDVAAASELARETGAGVAGLDVSDATAVQAVMAQDGPFEIVVNNAGIDQHAFFTDTTTEDWARLIAVNLTSVLACTHAALPAMQAAHFGRIINVTSEAARLGSKGGAVYSAAKGGVISFTRSIARENARYGITANAIAPGPIRTPMLEQAVAKGGDRILQAMTGATLLGRLGEPEEVAAAALFLASDQGRLYHRRDARRFGRHGHRRLKWAARTTISQSRRSIARSSVCARSIAAGPAIHRWRRCATTGTPPLPTARCR
ncbi:SDR family NAD(P)-dependent oxidoreductase [Bradyrhizobium sp. USDA 3315]